MAQTLQQKLRLKTGNNISIISAPDNYADTLISLVPGINIVHAKKEFQQVHLFVRNINELNEQFSKVNKLLTGEKICWVFFPKGTSGVQTDLNRERGWNIVGNYEKLQWLNLISFDATWSAFAVRMVQQDEPLKTKENKPREISKWVDAETRIVRIPPELKKLFLKEESAGIFFDLLSFTNKKEFIEWIVSAKKEETKERRLHETIVKLKKGCKNPGKK